MQILIEDLCSHWICHFTNLPFTSHDAWIEQIIHTETEPCWICDTDVVFWGSVEWWNNGWDTYLGGRFEPQWYEPWTKCERQERLHTALMFLNPVELRNKIRAWMGTFPSPWGTTCQNALIRQTRIPRVGQPDLFLDSTAGLYAAIGGIKFSTEMDSYWDHLSCGSYSDAISEHETYKNLAEFHAEAIKNPAMVKGLKKLQDEFYAKHSIDKPTPEPNLCS